MVVGDRKERLAPDGERREPAGPRRVEERRVRHVHPLGGSEQHGPVGALQGHARPSEAAAWVVEHMASRLDPSKVPETAAGEAHVYLDDRLLEEEALSVGLGLIMVLRPLQRREHDRIPVREIRPALQMVDAVDRPDDNRLQVRLCGERVGPIGDRRADDDGGEGHAEPVGDERVVARVVVDVRRHAVGDGYDREGCEAPLGGGHREEYDAGRGVEAAAGGMFRDDGVVVLEVGPEAGVVGGAVEGGYIARDVAGGVDNHGDYHKGL
eukprot:CAMPEP_0180413054 /NCGR_PEP_ID=MMETSP0989-20121125/44869_1 /TAXON_ID=697907 /ORGANISM="non described non described, Strain CCMP2293" /LENGTH=266 /DNA_ID=CAMNT_0022417561 /DNA_START=134 /DNA_END=933 /DNA_ORIENTATION=+